MRYFTSDLHLQHPFIAALRGFFRPYDQLDDKQMNIVKRIKSGENPNRIIHEIGEEAFCRIVDVEAHDKAVIKNINARVGKKDELYILGDISSGGMDNMCKALNYIDQLHVLPSRRHLILGNHEGFALRPANANVLATRFGTITDIQCITISDEMVVLSHTPAARRMNGARMNGIAANSLSKTLKKHAPAVPKGILHLHGHTHSKRPDEFGTRMEINVGLDAWKLKPVSEDEILEYKNGDLN